MLTFETIDKRLARRSRMAQFNGRSVTVRSSGSMVTGRVRSVLQIKSSVPPRWTITIVPRVPLAKFEPARRASRSYAFAKGF